MNFRDRWEEDEQGRRFVFTVEMQRRLSQAGLPLAPSALAELEKMPGGGRPQHTERPSHEERYERRESPSSRQDDSQPHYRQAQSREPEIGGPETIQIDPMTGKYIGRIKWYNAKKGYGFIVRGAGEEIFFHKSATVGEVEEYEEGQWILYDVETTNKGPEATDIEPFAGEAAE